MNMLSLQEVRSADSSVQQTFEAIDRYYTDQRPVYLVNHNFDRPEMAPHLFLWTIQGEGRRSGMPSLVIRFGGCNLDCRGFGCEYLTPSGESRKGCDSWFASNWDFKDLAWEKFTSAEDIIQAVRASKPADFADNFDVVITGGEPTLSWEKAIFQQLLAYFFYTNHQVTIETNGTHNFKTALREFYDNEEVTLLGSLFTARNTFAYQRYTVMSCSPKLAVSGNEFEKRHNPENIVRFLTDMGGYLKFVISAETYEQDVEEITQLLNEIVEFTKDVGNGYTTILYDELINTQHYGVYIMPLGEITDNIKKNEMAAVDLCTQKGFTFCPRVHVMLWENEFGH